MSLDIDEWEKLEEVPLKILIDQVPQKILI